MAACLLAGFPGLRTPSESWPVILEDRRDAFHGFSSDFAVLDKGVRPAFAEYDKAALNLRAAEIDWDSADPHGDMAAELGRVEQIFRAGNGQWGQLVMEGTPKRPPAGPEGQ